MCTFWVLGYNNKNKNKNKSQKNNSHHNRHKNNSNISDNINSNKHRQDYYSCNARSCPSTSKRTMPGIT